jgi:hypothetical protein
MSALWPIILVAAHSALAEVPRFDIEPTCRGASVSNSAFKRPQGACERDEQQARDTLRQKWTTFTVAERQRCTTMTEVDGSPSYVELLTCLQTASEAAKLPKKGLEEPPK